MEIVSSKALIDPIFQLGERKTEESSEVNSEVVQPPADWRLGFGLDPQLGERKTEESSEDNSEVVQPPADWRLGTFICFYFGSFCLSINI